MDATTPDSDICLDAAQLAARWVVSEDYLFKLRRAGKLKCLKIGRCVRFRMKDILEFEAAALEQSRGTA
jgi:hypothetical protein